MKRTWMAMVMTAAVVAAVMAKDKEKIPGVPAILEAITGKKAPVFLQGMEDGKVKFIPYRGKKEFVVPVSKVKTLNFPLKNFDEKAVEKQFSEGKFDEVIGSLASLLAPYEPYMSIENNLRSAYLMLFESYREKGDFDKVRKMALVLMVTGDPRLQEKGRVGIVLADVAAGDLEKAREDMKEVQSEAARLYLEAVIAQAEKEPKKAIRTVVQIIRDHGNDMDWLPPAELMCARLYLDLGFTNSADHTARQVKNMYKGTYVGAEAKKLYDSLPHDKQDELVEKQGEATSTNAVDSEVDNVLSEIVGQAGSDATSTETNETSSASAATNAPAVEMKPAE